MNFSLNAKKRVPSQLQTLLRQRQIQQQQQQQHKQLPNIVKEHMNTDVLPVIVEENVKDVITYDIGEPQPCVEEPVIETLSSVVVDDGANTNTGSEVEVLEVIEETVVEPADEAEQADEEEEEEADASETPEATETVEATEAVSETDTKKKKKGKNGRK